MVYKGNFYKNLIKLNKIKCDESVETRFWRINIQGSLGKLLIYRLVY